MYRVASERLSNARRLRAMVRRQRALAPLSLATGLSWRALLLAGTMLSAHAAFAQSTKLPTGGQVVAGGASIAQPSTNQMVITQSTQNVAINWQTFNIGAGYGVQFVQPSSSAIAVNRVIGLNGPSQILGTLTANGQVYIINPSGVVFGKGAVVNTGALVASTRDMDVAQFMAGNITLAGGSTGNGKVVNAGTITTGVGGYVVLAGDKVVNAGTINTPGGSTVLAAGDQATVALSNGQLVNVTMNAAVANATVKNSGVIKAEGGKVVLSANGAGTVIGGAVNITGAVDVSSALAGDITVDAGAGGTVLATDATLKAVSTAGKGGCVTLAGDKVGLFGTTKVNVSGSTGGGTVLAGGGAHGSDTSIRNATATVMAPTARIDASATDKGDGGTVVLWSNDYTGFYGTITAQGGPNGGKGGWVETSSHDNLQAWGQVKTGLGGSWLLDPTDVTIDTAANVGETFDGTTWQPSGSLATINVAALDAQLNAGGSIIITTTSCVGGAGLTPGLDNTGTLGNIAVNTNIAKTSAANASLTLVASGAITMNANTAITSSAGTLNVTMSANSSIVLTGNDTIALSAGNFTAQSCGSVQVGSNTTICLSSGTANLSAANGAGLSVTGTNITASAVMLSAQNASSLTVGGGAILAGGDISVVGTNLSGLASLSGLNLTTTGGNISVNVATNGSGLQLSNTNLTAPGTVTLNGSGAQQGISGSGVTICGSQATVIGQVSCASGGLAVSLNGTVNASGAVTINGSSAGVGSVMLSGESVHGTNVTITGTAGCGTGVQMNGTTFTVASLAVTGSGNGPAATSVMMSSGGVNATGCVSFNGTGSLCISSANITGTTVMACASNGSTFLFSGDTINATGDITLNGTNISVQAFVQSTNLTTTGGNISVIGLTNGSGLTMSSDTLTASGTVTINGSGIQQGASGTGLTICGSQATVIGQVTCSSGGVAVNLSGSVNASGAVTINGSGGGVGGVILSGETVKGTNVTVTGIAGCGTGVQMTCTTFTVASLAVTGSGNGPAATSVMMSSGGVNATGCVSFNGTGSLCISSANITGTTVTACASNGSTFLFSGDTINATGDITLNGTNISVQAFVQSTNLTTTGGNISVIGLTNGSGLIMSSDTLTASGTVTVNGSGLQQGISGTGVAICGSQATIIGQVTCSSGGIALNLSGSVNASGTVTINGSGGGVGGVILSGETVKGTNVTVTGVAGCGTGVQMTCTTFTVASLAVTGSGNGPAATSVMMSSVGVNATGCVSFNGTGSMCITGTNITGSTVTACTSNGPLFLLASDTVNATGDITLNGTNMSVQAFVQGSNLTTTGGNISVMTNGSGLIMSSDTLTASGTVTVNGSGLQQGISGTGLTICGSQATIIGQVTCASGGVAVNLSGSVNASGTVTINGSSASVAGVVLSSETVKGTDVTITGISGCGTGVQMTGTTFTVASLAVTGSGNGSAATSVMMSSGGVNATGCVSFNGTGSMCISSANITGSTVTACASNGSVFFFSGDTINSTGDITLNGTNMSVQAFVQGSNLTTTGGNISVMTTGSGLIMSSETLSACGTVTINSSGLQQGLSGTGLTICGSQATIIGQVTCASGSYAVNLSGAVNVSGAVTINGSSSGIGGVMLSSETVKGTDVTITGIAGCGTGVQMTGTTFNVASLAVTGSGNGPAATSVMMSSVGVNATGCVSFNGTGSMCITGTNITGSTVTACTSNGPLFLLASDTVNATGDITLNGTNISIQAFVQGSNLTTTGGNISVIGLTNGSGLLMGTDSLNASGTVTINGSGAQQGLSATSLTICASQATLTGQVTCSSGSVGVNVSGLNASGTNVTINGTGGGFQGVALAGTINVASLTVCGSGSTVGVQATATINATGCVSLTGTGNASTGVLAAGCISTTGGDITVVGTSSTGFGVQAGGVTLNAGSNNVTVSSTSQIQEGSGGFGGLLITANVATLCGTTTSGAYGVNLTAPPAQLNVSTLVLNGTGGTNAAVTFTPCATATYGNLTIVGNDSASASGAGVIVNGSINLAGNVSVNGTAGGNGTGIALGSISSTNGSIVAFGASNTGFALCASSAVNLCATNGSVTLGGSSVAGLGFSSGANLSVNSPIVTIIGCTTNGSTGAYIAGTGSLPTFTNLSALTIQGYGGSDVGVLLGPIGSAIGNASLTVYGQGQGGVRASTVVMNGALNITGQGNLGAGITVVTWLTSCNSHILLNGTSNSGAGIDMIGIGLNAASGITICGSSASSVGVNLTFSTINSSRTGAAQSGLVGSSSAAPAAALVINGTSGSGTGVRIANTTLNACATQVNDAGLDACTSAPQPPQGPITINGTSSSGIGVNIASLNLLSPSTGSINGTVNSGASAVLINGMSATSVPNLTINGIGGSNYAVVLTGTLNASNLSVLGCTTTANAGGIWLNSSLVSTGSVTLNGTGANIGLALCTSCASGRVNITASGNISLTGSGGTGDGIAYSAPNASLAAGCGTGTITMLGSSNGADGVNIAFATNTSLTLTASSANITGTSNAAGNNITNGTGVAIANLNASAVPTLTINGNGSGVAGAAVNLSGNVSVANMTVTGANAAGGISDNATITASGDVTLNGTVGTVFEGVAISAGATVGGNLTILGTASSNLAFAPGVQVIGGVLTASNGSILINGTSNAGIGVNVGAGSQAVTVPFPMIFPVPSSLSAKSVTIFGSSNGSSRGLDIEGSNVTGQTIVLCGTSTGNVGLVLVGANVTGNGAGSATLNANSMSLSSANFTGNQTSVVLQAVNTAAPMTINGTGANFGNVASVAIGGANQAGDLNYAVNSTYRGFGNFSITTGAANITLNGNINASQAIGSILLQAGNGVPLNVSQDNLNVTGGDVLVGSATSLAAGSCGTVVIWSGNDRTASYLPLVSGSNASNQVTCSTLAGAGTVNGSVKLNMFYRFAPPPTVEILITNASKTYDGTGIGLNYSVVMLYTNDTAPTVTMQGNFSSSSNLTNGSALHAGLYTISQGNATFQYSGNYALKVVNGTINVAQAPLTVNATSDTKTYDGTVTSNATATITGMVAGDSFKADAETFANFHAGNTTLAAGNLTNTSFNASTAGSLIGDYNITYVTANGTITPKALTVTANTDTKVYDGTATSTVLATVSGNIAGDTFTNASLAQVFNSSHALGTNGSTLNLAVGNLTNASFATSNAGNVGRSGLVGDSGAVQNGSFITDYCITYCTAQGTVTPAALTVTATTGIKTYDGNTSSTSLATVSGNIAGDSFTVSSLAEAYNSSHALGANGSTLNVANALTNASFMTHGCSGVGLSCGATVACGSAITDYNITYVTTQGTITPAALTVTAQSTTKVYDGTANASGCVTVCGTIAGDNFSASALTQAFTNNHVQGANASTVNIATALTSASFSTNTSGSVITDYCVSYTTANGTITPKALTVTAAGGTKVYDGTNASNASATVCGTIAGDSFKASCLSEVFNTTHAGNATLSLNGGNLTNSSFATSTSGSFITDYCVSYGEGAAHGNITPKAVTVTASTDTKVYDGTILSTMTPTVNGAIAGDTFNTAGTGQAFASQHALGTGNSTLLATGCLSIANSTAGSCISDYCVSFVNATGTITPKALTVTATTDTKTYDGTTTSTAVATVCGTIAGDSINTSCLTEVFNSSHALGTNGSTLNVANALTNASLTTASRDSLVCTSAPIGCGSAITDYNITYVTTQGTITPAALTVTATTGTKVYDGTNSSTSLATVTGNIAGDTFTNASLAEVYNNTHVLGTNNSTLNVAGAFTNASFATNGSRSGLVGTSLTVRSASVVSDYNITYVTTQGTITPAPLTVTAQTATKVYDGTNAANGTATVCGTIAGDSFSNASLAQTFTNIHVNGTNGSTVNIATALTNASFTSNTSGSVITDYNVSYVAATGTIAARTLNVTATSDTKVYDGTLNSSAPMTVSGTIAGDTFTNASLTQSFTSIHVNGTNGSLIVPTAPLTNASFAASTAGSFITDYNVAYAPALGTITARPLNVTATPDTKAYDGSTSSGKLMTVTGNIAGDTFNNADLAQVFASAGCSTQTTTQVLGPARNLSGFANTTAGSRLTDYNITYTGALGTITGQPAAQNVTVIIPPPNNIDGTVSSTAASLGTWLNSGGSQQNMPSGLSQNDNVLHLIFTTGAGGQPLIQASWSFFNPTFSGSINLPVNTNASP